MAVLELALQDDWLTETGGTVNAAAPTYTAACEDNDFIAAGAADLVGDDDSRDIWTINNNKELS